MELRASMELGGGRGGQLGEDDSPFIVIEQIQPLSTNSACDKRYYHARQVVLPHGSPVLLLARQELDQPVARAVEPLERYYHTPLQYYRKAGLV